MRFPVLIKHEDLGYVATEISSGVASQGETVEEAMDMLKEALELYYEDSEPGAEDTANCFLTTMEVSV
ncbi:MAG: type II toxin-antitoxin system HicB family antitoxin [Lachnospiraceae bacterium]|nr:type II toxin-antitoxin system HicB family antitoxin [Lachnospiraceae bacterium]